jgi:predicted amino acid dehydrogenase
MLKNSRGTNARAPQLVQRAVHVAAAIGCGVVSLGQFTSIVTRRGATLDRSSRQMRITAGSSYTAALVDQAVRAELAHKAWDPADLVLGVVGATGDIAGTCASVLAPCFKRSVLVGSGRIGSLERLQSIMRRIPRASVATDPRELEKADVIVCATNSTSAVIGPECLRADAIICDASVPASVSPCISQHMPNVTLCPGAIVELPHRECVNIPGFPLPSGYTYGCMAEGLLIGLEGDQLGRWRGRSSPSQARRMSQIGDRHGFRVATAALVSHAPEPIS